MTRKDIDKAAGEYSGSILGCKGSSVKVKYQSFIDGAEWRINSIWHDASEKPQDLRMLVAINKDGFPLVCGPNNTHWEETVKVFEVAKWAYIDDLLPIKED